MDNEAQTFEDRFLDAVLDKGPFYGLIGTCVLAAFIAVVQVVLVVTK